MPPRKNANKRPKDLNAPKRPASSYILFNKTRQKTLREEHPDKKLTELTKLIGAEWKTLSDEAKQPFEVEASAAKEKYKTAMEEYQKSDLYTAFQAKLKAWKIRQKGGANSDSEEDDEDAGPPPPLPKRPKDPNAPKKSLSAFFIFQTARRKELKGEFPDKKNTELSKMAGTEWNEMDADRKAPFEAQAKVKKEEYNTALAAYKLTEEFRQYEAKLAAWKELKKNPPKKPKKKKKQRSPSPQSDSDGSEESGDGSSEDSSDEDGDSRMRGRESSSSDEEYSSESE